VGVAAWEGVRSGGSMLMGHAKRRALFGKKDVLRDHPDL
jgi:hypothetical protein